MIEPRTSEGVDLDDWDYAPGERPDLPTFDPEEIEAAIWRLKMENTL